MPALDLYHRAPYTVRCAAASLRGGYLRAWRYGRATSRLTAEALAREHWTAEQWSVWQTERLRALLCRARFDVPYYRDHWERHRKDSGDWRDLEAWPVLSKQAIREHADRLVADRSRPRWTFAEHTSGTTGTPLTLQISRANYQFWYALAEARWRRWYGVSRADHWAILGGQLVVRPTTTEPPYWVWNAALHQLYLSSYHINPATAASYGRALDEHKVKYLLGYPSAMHSLATGLADAGYVPQPFEVAIGNAEPVLPHQRQAIGEVFGCEVRETYGMSEYVAAASECECGELHLWPEVGIVEIHDSAGVPQRTGVTGQIVATSLVNTDMPLIRYQVGDTASVAPGSAECCCGRTLPLLENLEGRTDDLAVAADGTLIGRLDPVFKADLLVREAQIVQDAIGRFRILVVPEPGFTDSCETEISRRLIERVGPASVEIETVKSIPRGPGGKFKAVLSHVAPSDGNPSP